jgi:hypothetical protein
VWIIIISNYKPIMSIIMNKRSIEHVESDTNNFNQYKNLKKKKCNDNNMKWCYFKSWDILFVTHTGDKTNMSGVNLRVRSRSHT